MIPWYNRIPPYGRSYQQGFDEVATHSARVFLMSMGLGRFLPPSTCKAHVSLHNRSKDADGLAHARAVTIGSAMALGSRDFSELEGMFVSRLINVFTAIKHYLHCG